MTLGQLMFAKQLDIALTMKVLSRFEVENMQPCINDKMRGIFISSLFYPILSLYHTDFKIPLMLTTTR